MKKIFAFLLRIFNRANKVQDKPNCTPIPSTKTWQLRQLRVRMLKKSYYYGSPFARVKAYTAEYFRKHRQ